jgi:xylulokinase
VSWLGIDVGTTNTKVCLIPDGRTMTARTPEDARELQTTTLRLIDEITQDHTLEGIGVTGMAETGVPLDHDLQPLTPLISWRDQPGVEQAAELAEQLGPRELFSRTGLRLSAKLPVITWRWLGEDLSARTRTWAGASDLVLAALTGAYATHLTHAQRLGVLDLRKRSWDPDLLAFGGFRADQLPRIAEPMTINARTASGIPVVLCGHDHLVASWAAGVRAPGQVADSLGTSEAVVTPSTTPVLADVLRQQGISSGWYADGRHGCAISGNGAAGGLIEQRLAYFGRDYEWLASVLEVVGQPSAEVIAPYPAGRQAPNPDPAARYDVRAAAADPAAAMRALVDALALHARWMAEEQTSLLGIEWRSTVAFGGPAKLAGWIARKALASAGAGLREFSVVAEDATGAVGAALMASEVVTGDPAGVLDSSALRVDPVLAADWDSHFWHRFHTVVSGPPPT